MTKKQVFNLYKKLYLPHGRRFKNWVDFLESLERDDYITKRKLQGYKASYSEAKND